MTTALATGVHAVDLEFLGEAGIIATVVLHGRQGVALIDPGPSTALRTLTRALDRRGFGLGDVRAILLTHVHLDHAGAAGTLLASCPGAMVFVHAHGARHLVDPSRLLASATQLYGSDMDRLWGEVRPVPADRVRVLGDADRLEIVGHNLESMWTPGHARHHVSYFLRDAGIAFVGDTAGICRPSGRVVLPPTPPPDIDLEAWRASTHRILAWHPDVLFLTHFGPQSAPRVHVQALWERTDAWSDRVRAQLDRPGTDEERIRQFTDEVMLDMQRATSRDEALAYSRAGRFDLSWLGLARYWRKKAARSATAS